jgi:hypothetical protein
MGGGTLELPLHEIREQGLQPIRREEAEVM